MPAARSPAIPVVDLREFSQSSSAATKARKDAAESLIQACHEQGFVGISGHSLSPSTLAELFNTSQKLFSMPVEEKIKAPHPIDSFVPHRGYTGVGGEKCFTKDEMLENRDNEDFWKTKIAVKDFKESFEVGSEDNKTHYNIWYPEDTLPGFRKFTLKAYWELHGVCMQILEAFMLGLHLSETEKENIRSIHSGLNDQLRLLHYPPLPAAAANDPASSRMQPHTDWSTFTLLFQDSCGGLEFGDRGKEGAFIPATPQDGVVYLNVGDMLTRISNDYLPSAMHRVVLPEGRTQSKETGETTTPERYSIPYFFLPDDDKKVATPETVLKAHGPRIYDPITMLEYAELRSKWLYKKDEETS